MNSSPSQPTPITSRGTWRAARALVLYALFMMVVEGELGCKKPQNTTVIAAIQYAPGDASKVDPACTRADRADLCALETLVVRAAARGAEIIVTPEYATEQPHAALVPKVDDIPWQDERWASQGALSRMSALARRHKLYLAVNLITYTPLGDDDELDEPNQHNTLIFLGPKGQVLARHHKFELFAGESQTLTPGERVHVVQTPLGRIGLLICADLYGDMRLHHELTQTKDAQLVLVSAAWTAQGATAWPANFARDWDVFVASANTTQGPGRGGGVFSPKRAMTTSAKPGFTLAIIPSFKTPKAPNT